ncbi:hypothetical protein HK100_012760 [Physocladia obscura]|uniref:Uncharacterized protein n=1 Tax=Physocladia obscura TaxID=109957 RepID=A0AAD5XFN2_9FUNG|nr:hypothetical protein HK100_012760 [Physocladia obscura]
MSPEIADPSRHEKILSFLKSETNRLPALSLVNEPFNALSVSEKCLGSNDDRLVSLALRFVGKLCFDV